VWCPANDRVSFCVSLESIESTEQGLFDDDDERSAIVDPFVSAQPKCAQRRLEQTVETMDKERNDTEGVLANGRAAKDDRALSRTQ